MSVFSRLANLWKGFISLFVSDVEPPVPAKVEPIVKEVFWKKLSILGAQATGKTRLWDYITKGLIGQGYKVTISQETQERDFILDGQRIIVARSHDLGGDIAFLDAWKALYDTSDILVYLVNGAALFSQDLVQRNRVESDLNEIRNWRESDKIRKTFIILVTWCDKVAAFQDKLPRGITGDIQLLKNLRPLADPVLTMGAHIILGSTEPDKISDTTAILFHQARLYK